MDGRAADGTQEFWLYGPDSQTARLEVFSGTGQPVTDIGIVVAQHGEVETSVSYPTRTWWRGQAQEAPNAFVGPSCGVPDISPAAVLSATFREDLACGLFTDEGTQYVDGVNAIKLVSVRTVQGVASTDAVWVDPASYLPVRWAESQGTVSVFDDDFRWLPPTSANLAQLTAPIPAGFRQVPPPQH